MCTSMCSISSLLVRECLGEFTSENRRTMCDKKIGSNIFIVGKFCKIRTCKPWVLKIMKYVYM